MILKLLTKENLGGYWLIMSKKLIIIFITASLFLGTASALTYSLTLNYQNETLQSESVELLEGPPPNPVEPETGYQVEMVSFNGSVLHSRTFSMNTQIMSAPKKEWFNDEGEQVVIPNSTTREIGNVTRVIKLPYYSTAERLIIKDEEGDKELEESLRKYSSCNLNDICESREDAEECSDCRGSESSGSLLSIIYEFLMSLIHF